MRAIVIELSGRDDADIQGLIDASARAALEAGSPVVARAEGSLRGAGPEPLPDPDAGEPH
jgi:hypothetical protein